MSQEESRQRRNGSRRTGGRAAAAKRPIGSIALASVAVSVFLLGLYGLARPGLVGTREAPTNRSLKIGITQEFENLNPVIMSMSATNYMYARFVEFDGVRKLEADWHILPAATWGDGTPVTCHDLQLSWEVAQSPYVSIPNVENYRQVEQIRIDPQDP
ncbi:MAG: hypothetical protein AMJ58_12205, partial [Gammaproteobacteria bacterium SG8_30]